jgi:hypothetical protein
MATNKRLSATITIGGAISGTLKGAFGEVKGKLGEVGKAITDLTKRQKLLGKAIQEFGRTGKDVDGLRNSYAKLTQQIERAQRAQSRLKNAMQFKETAGKVGGYLKSAAGYSAVGAGALGLVGRATVGAAIERENAVNVLRNSGASKQEQDEMISAAQSSKQFGVSVTEATKIVGELRASLGSASHAIEALPTALAAKSGLQLYNRSHPGHEIDDDAAYSLAKIADERGGATNPAEMRKQMNWAFKAITGSQGKLTAADLLTAQRGAKAAGVAATDEAFFGDTFLMQALGAPGYGKALSTLNNAWIGGHQDKSHLTNMLKDGLLDPKKVTLKNGLVDKYSPEALVNHGLFIQDQQAWVEKYLVPLAKRQGVNLDDDAAVQAFAASITSNTNATNMVFQRLKNRTSIDRDRQNVLQANGITASDTANQNSSAGKMGNAQARLNDAEARVGAVLLPKFASAMEKTATALERVNEFAKEHPALFRTVVEGLGALAVGLAVAAPVLLVANGVLQTIAAVKLARAAAEVTSLTSALGGVEGAAAKAGGGVLGLIGKFGLALGLAQVALAAAKAAGLPDVDKKQGIADVTNGDWWAASAHLSAGDFLSAGWNRITGKSDADIAASLAGKKSGGGGSTDNSVKVQTINVYAQNPQDGTALANDFTREIQKRQAVKSRSIMFDGASQ